MNTIKYIAPAKEEILFANAFFPRRIRYWLPFWRVINTFAERRKIHQLPEVEAFLARFPEFSSVIGECVQSVLGGHSLNVGKGRYLPEDRKPVDEKVWIVQIVVRPTSSIAMPPDEFLQIAGIMIHHLIAAKLATETGGREEEVWMVTWPGTLWRWIKQQ